MNLDVETHTKDVGHEAPQQNVKKTLRPCETRNLRFRLANCRVWLDAPFDDTESSLGVCWCFHTVCLGGHNDKGTLWKRLAKWGEHPTIVCNGEIAIQTPNTRNPKTTPGEHVLFSSSASPRGPHG